MNNEFKIILATCILFTFPVMISTGMYRDDLIRASYGLYGWSVLGRPFADALVGLLTFSSTKLMSPYPYSQILAAIFFCLSTYSIFNSYLKEIYGGLFISLSLMITPLMVQNISYQYDSLPMSLGLYCAVISGIYYNKFYISIPLLISSLLLYQPCANIFIGVYAINSACSCLKSIIMKDELIKLVKYIFIYVTSMVIYSLILLPAMSVNTRSDLIFNAENPITFLFNNVDHYYRIVEAVYIGHSRYIALVLIFGMIGGFIVKILNSSNKKIVFILFATSLAAGIISCFGPLILLQDPASRLSRTMVGFGALICVPMIWSTNLFMLLKLKYLYFIPVLFSFSVSSSYSNGARAQNNFEQSLASMIVRDASSIKYKNMFFYGSTFYSPEAKIIADNSYVFRSTYIPAREWIMSTKVINLGGKDVDYPIGNYASVRKLVTDVCNNKDHSIMSNNLYDFYLYNGSLLVFLKDGKNNLC
ncbi:glucosyltransferase domain-containing protein [Enterobacter hormaechei subsp. xiangfangensis]